MSFEMKKRLCLSEVAMANIEERMAELAAQGVVATEAASGELNISGCASSSCMAWD